MPFHLTTATTDERDLVVESLRSAASQRTRVASKAATELYGADGPKDKRPAAVRLASLLADAGRLEQLAGDLEDAPDATLVEQTIGGVPIRTDATLAVGTAQLVDDTGQVLATVVNLDGLEPPVPPQDRDPDDAPIPPPGAYGDPVVDALAGGTEVTDPPPAIDSDPDVEAELAAQAARMTIPEGPTT